MNPTTEKGDGHKRSDCLNSKSGMFCAFHEEENMNDTTTTEKEWENKWGKYDWWDSDTLLVLKEVFAADEKSGAGNVDMLRQWLNEDRITDPKKLVTNEDITYWLEAARSISGEEK